MAMRKAMRKVMWGAIELGAARMWSEEANCLVAQLREEVALLTKSNSDTQRLLEKERLKSKRF